VSDIDPVQFGHLTAQVSLLEDQVTELRSDVKTLLELANKSKGGFWAGMAIASFLGSFATLVVELFVRKS
jgi:hypothetical protein